MCANALHACSGQELVGRMLCTDPSLLAVHMHVVSRQAVRKAGNPASAMAKSHRCGLAYVLIFTDRRFCFRMSECPFNTKGQKQRKQLCVPKAPDLPQADVT